MHGDFISNYSTKLPKISRTNYYLPLAFTNDITYLSSMKALLRNVVLYKSSVSIFDFHYSVNNFGMSLPLTYSWPHFWTGFMRSPYMYVNNKDIHFPQQFRYTFGLLSSLCNLLNVRNDDLKSILSLSYCFTPCHANESRI